MGSVVRLGDVVDPRVVLQQALDRDDLAEVIVLARTKDGSEFANISFCDGPQAIWHLQRAIHRIMRYAEKLDEQDG